LFFFQHEEDSMARQARVVVPLTPHHVVQRGNRRQQTFFSDADYLAYLDIAAECFGRAGVEVWAYCLMPNHVHLIATPSTSEALAEAVGSAHLKYTRLINRREEWTGFLWQGRFASFPMDEHYLMTCARYVGLNPVRAGLTKRAIDWRWSSVRAHVEGRADPLLTARPLAERLGESVAGFFDVDVDEDAAQRLRRASATGRPVGAREWLEALEVQIGRLLQTPVMGRPGEGTCTSSYVSPVSDASR
jgi:putative transposase